MTASACQPARRSRSAQPEREQSHTLRCTINTVRTHSRSHLADDVSTILLALSRPHTGETTGS